MPKPRTPTQRGSIFYVIHCRVSSAKQAYEGESLDVQESICRDIATERGWEIAHEPWKEAFSGRRIVRPVFKEILAFIDANPGLIQKYVFRSIDRLTRRGSFSYEQMKRELDERGVEMVDSYGVIQSTQNTLKSFGFEYEWSKHSPSSIAEVVVAAAAKTELTNILTRLIGQEISLTQRGYKIRQAQDGYVNERVYVDGKKRTVMKPDPNRAHFIKTMFAMRASGQADEQICNYLNAAGYRRRTYNRWDKEHRHVIGQSRGGPLVPKKLQEMVQRPIYCGVVYEKWTNWEPIAAAYDGLVSIELFNAANRGKVAIFKGEDGSLEIQSGDKPKQKCDKANPQFPFKNVVLCPACRKPFSGSSPRGHKGRRYPTYHCSRNHKYIGISKTIFEKTVKNFFDSIRIAPDNLSCIRVILLNKYMEQQGQLLDTAALMNQSVAELEIELAATVRAFRDARIDIVRESLEQEADRLGREIKRGRVVRDRVEVTESDIEGLIREAKYVLERPGLLLNSQPIQRKNALYQFFFDGLPTYTELQLGTAKLGRIFRLCSEFEPTKSQCVHPLRLSWNEIKLMVGAWKASKHLLPLAFVAQSDEVDISEQSP